MNLVAAETITAETLIVDGLDERMLNFNENAVELPNRTVSSGYKMEKRTIDGFLKQSTAFFFKFTI